MFFGGGAGSRDPNAPRQGNDLQYTITLDFEEAIFGKELNITVPREENVLLVMELVVSQERNQKLVPIVMERSVESRTEHTFW